MKRILRPPMHRSATERRSCVCVCIRVCVGYTRVAPAARKGVYQYFSTRMHMHMRSRCEPAHVQDAECTYIHKMQGYTMVLQS